MTDVKLQSEVKGVAKVIGLGGKSTTGSIEKMPAQKKRRIFVWVSFILFVVLPTLLGGYYYTVVASDRFVSGAGFSIRGVDAGGSLDGLGALTGLVSSGSTTSDSYIVLKYMKSRDLVEKLQNEIGLRQLYSNDSIDYISKMNPEVMIERFTEYWDGKISTSFNLNSGIVDFEVEAFVAEDAKKIAELVLKYTDQLVNQLSEDARRDAVKFAEAEVVVSEERLRLELQKLREFREKEKSISLQTNIKLDIELVAALKSQLIDIETRIATLSNSVDENAPSLVSLKRQGVALQEQIEKNEGSVGLVGGSNANISTLLATFEALEVEKEFAQRAYASALTSLETARLDAGRQQRYLAVYSTPALPQEAIYPQRILNAILLAIILLCFWGIITLIVYSVRDHLS